MKFYVACIFICYIASAYGLFGPQLQVKLQATEDACLSQTGDSLRTIDMTVRYRRRLPSDGSLDKFAACILKRYYILNADDTVNPDVKKYYLISDDGGKKKYAEQCRVLTGNDKYETVRKIFECFLHTDIYLVDFAYRGQYIRT